MNKKERKGYVSTMLSNKTNTHNLKSKAFSPNMNEKDVQLALELLCHILLNCELANPTKTQPKKEASGVVTPQKYSSSSEHQQRQIRNRHNCLTQIVNRFEPPTIILGCELLLSISTRHRAGISPELANSVLDGSFVGGSKNLEFLRRLREVLQFCEKQLEKHFQSDLIYYKYTVDLDSSIRHPLDM